MQHLNRRWLVPVVHCKLLHSYLHVKGYVSVATPNSFQLEVEAMEGHHLGVVVWFLRLKHVKQLT